MSVAAPPIEAAEQLLSPKPKSRELARPFGRCVAANSVAIDNVHLVAVELSDGLPVHVAMWEVERPGDMASYVCVARASIDHDDVGDRSLQIDGQIS